MLDQSLDHHYFVDEAGDLSLFNKRGETLLGTPGVSRTFMVGTALIRNADGVRLSLERLRASLLSDPYFQRVPSLQPASRKTAIAFHAKDDLPEVRERVFRIIRTADIRWWVAIRRKQQLIEESRAYFATSGRKTRADEVYDDLVKRLFKTLQHKGESIQITFARRGKRARQAALETALDRARANFRKSYGNAASPPRRIISGVPSEHAGLQVVDYGLWALQRAYERSDWRYFDFLRDKFRLIMDLDDKRAKPYGEWYSSSNQLDSRKIKPVEG